MNIPVSRIVKNKVILFLVSRYLTYFLHFLTSLLVAAKLGPYYMGIWGFLLLILNYFHQLHFGIANSFNVLYVQHRDNQEECDKYIVNSLFLVGGLGVIIIAFYLYYISFGINVFIKYHSDNYVLIICIIAILQHFTTFFINLFRVKNLLNHVTFSQSIVIILNFVVIFFFEGEQLICALVYGYLIGNLLCVLLAYKSKAIPSLKRSHFVGKYQLEIIKKGLFLFLYNTCFYFIVISIRTIISANYTVEEFGLFTFSFSLAHSILLVLEAVSFIIFPKVVGKMSSDKIDDVVSTIGNLRMIYISAAHLLVYIALLCFPIILYFLPKYSQSVTSLNLIALSILMSCNSYAYLELLISRNKEKVMAILSASALLVNCLIAMILTHLIKVGYEYVILATMITYTIYTYTIVHFGKKTVNEASNKSLPVYMPLRLILPYVSAVVISLLSLNLYLWIPLLLFIILNWNIKTAIYSTVRILVNKPEAVNL